MIWTQTSPKKMHRWQMSTGIKCLTPFAIRKMQFKTTMRNLYTPVLECLKLGRGWSCDRTELSYTACGDMEEYNYLGSCLAVL